MRHQGSMWGHTVAVDLADDFPVEMPLPYGWVPSTEASERTWSVRFEDGLWVPTGVDHPYSSDQPDYVARRLAEEVELHLAARAEGLIAIHAAVVAFAGVTVVAPGRTMSGKSRLAQALVAAGGSYFSDDLALIDPDGFVVAHPRPMGIRDDQGQRALVEVSSDASEPLPVGLVVSVRWQEGATWDVEPLSDGQVVLALLTNALAAQTRPMEALEHITTAVNMRSARGVSGLRGEAAAAAAEIKTLLGAHQV